jgi:mannose-6-phosphate isomerase-like protein (cupin superfamily)
VLSGRGVGRLHGKTHPLKPRTLLLIERGVQHEIRNTGTTPLRTLNIYVPPAYGKSGEELPRGRKP